MTTEDVAPSSILLLPTLKGPSIKLLKSITTEPKSLTAIGTNLTTAECIPSINTEASTPLSVPTKNEISKESSKLHSPTKIVVTKPVGIRLPTHLKYRSTKAHASRPLYYAGDGNNAEIIIDTLNELGLERSQNKERFKLKWTQLKSSINFREFREGIQLVNHFPNMDLIGNKRNLVENLREYVRVQGRVNPEKMIILDDFVPKTYILDTVKEREEFLKLVGEGGENIWICKPTHRNQGIGIFLIRDSTDIETKLSFSPTNPPQLYKGIRRLVQKYISNPLLLENRKFDLRVYMLIIAAKPYIVFYHYGYVRLSIAPFSLDDNDLHTHLTNQFIQKKHPDYEEIKETTVWDFKQFQDFIDTNAPQNVNLPPNWVNTVMTKRIQNIMQMCFFSIFRKLHHRIGYFELLGFDFMVDTEFNVWLIEVNVNPALTTNCEVLQSVIPKVIHSSISLSLEIFEKCIKHKPLFPIICQNDFEIIYKGK